MHHADDVAFSFTHQIAAAYSLDFRGFYRRHDHLRSSAKRVNKEPMTHPKASARGHTARATLELLPSVLVVIQRASRVLEQDLARDDRPARDFLRSLRTAAYSISSIFRELRDTGLDRELEEYAVALLDAVEASLDTEALGRAAWKVCISLNRIALCTKSTDSRLSQASDEKYSNSRALCHLQDTELTSQLLSAAFSLPYSSSHEDLLCTFTDTFDELQVCFPDLSELDLQPTRKRRREPPWGISDSASKAFRAISQCSHGPGCSVIKRLKTRLALATYSGIIEDEQHFVDMLLALDTEKPLWSEMRMHTHIDECGFTGADIKPAVPKVMFADNRGKPTTATYKPRGRAKPIPYFCKLLDASKAHFNATFRVNVTLDTNNEMWQHQPSNRYPKQADLSHSISLGDILASDTRDLNEMAKLVLALILSYSLFYLYGSPWLGPQNAAEWSRDKIIFFMKDGKDGKVPLRPFLRSDLPFNSPEASNVDGEAGDDDDTPFHPYPILVGFGIILLELHMGCTLESFLGLTEPLLSVDDKWARACDVFNQRKPFIPGQKYRNAIETCLDTQFGAGDDDLSGRWTGEDEEDIEQLRHQIFSKVVSPLQDELEYGFGAFIKSDDLDKEAASMDLISGLSVVEEKAYSPILHHTGHGHCMISAPHPTKTSLKAHKGIAPARVRSETPKGLRYAPDLPESIDAGELYTLFGDPNVPSSNSPHEYSPTDTWISKFRQLKALYPLQLLKQGDSNRVRVAIIDTGIDLGHVDMQAAVSDGRIAKVCDWVDGRGGIEDESTGDSIGHGTHITSIILDMAPNVDVYIGRVAKGRELSDDQAENVAKVSNLIWGTTTKTSLAHLLPPLP